MVKLCEDINYVGNMPCLACWYDELQKCRWLLYDNLSGWTNEVLIDENTDEAKGFDAVAQL